MECWSDGGMEWWSGGVVECVRIEVECEVHGIATTSKSSMPLFRVVFNPPRGGLPGLKRDEWRKQPESSYNPETGEDGSRRRKNGYSSRAAPTPTRPTPIRSAAAPTPIRSAQRRHAPTPTRFPSGAAGPACAARRRQPRDPQCIGPTGHRVFLQGPYPLWRRS
jgi:hypothetical protein